MDYTLKETHKQFKIEYRDEYYDVLATISIGAKNEPHFILRKCNDGKIFSLNIVRGYVDGLSEITHWTKI